MALTSYPETFIFTLVVISIKAVYLSKHRSDEFTPGSEMKLKVLSEKAKMAARVRHFLHTCLFELHEAYET